MELGGIRCRWHPLCRFLAGRQELLIGEEVFVGVQQQRGQRLGLGETIARRPQCKVPCQYSTAAPGTRELRYLRCIWTAGKRRHLQVLPPVQIEILRKRLKSEPLAWISALATCFSSKISQGWGSDKAFQVYLTETRLVVAHHALASPTARLREGR